MRVDPGFRRAAASLLETVRSWARGEVDIRIRSHYLSWDRRHRHSSRILAATVFLGTFAGWLFLAQAEGTQQPEAVSDVWSFFVRNLWAIITSAVFGVGAYWRASLKIEEHSRRLDGCATKEQIEALTDRVATLVGEKADKTVVDLQDGHVHSRITDMRSELKEQIGTVKSDLGREIGQLRDAVKEIPSATITQLRAGGHTA